MALFLDVLRFFFSVFLLSVLLCPFIAECADVISMPAAAAAAEVVSVEVSLSLSVEAPWFSFCCEDSWSVSTYKLADTAGVFGRKYLLVLAVRQVDGDENGEVLLLEVVPVGG